MRLLLVLALAVVAAPTADSPRLLMVGEFHGDDVSAKGGESVWALKAVDGRWALQKDTLVVDIVRDHIVDNDDGEMTGRRVSLASGATPVAMISGVALKAGPLTTVATGERSLMAGNPVRMELGTGRFSLEGFRDENGYRLVLSDGVTNQTLVTHETLDDGGPRLLWAGDIDRDGRPDFIIDTTHKYSYAAPSLFLSSAAGEGELVKLVATFKQYGC